MKRNGFKSMVLTLAFTVTIFAGATQTFAKPHEHNSKATKEIKVSVPKESKLKGIANAKAHGGNAYSHGADEDKLTGIENAKAHGGKAYSHGTVEHKLKGIENAKAHGGNAYAKEKVKPKVTLAKVKAVLPILKGNENAKAHGGNSNAHGKAPDKLTGVENARHHGGKAHAYGHCKMIQVIDLVQ